MVKKPFKYTHVGRLPEDWDCLQAIEVIDEISMGPFGSDITVSNFVSSGVPVLNGYNVSQIMLIDKFQNFVTPKKAKELKKAVAHRGDIIVTHRGTIGQVSYIPDSSAYSEYVISQSQFRVHFNDKRVNSHFLVSYLLSPIGQKYLLETKGHTGVPALAQPTTNFRRLWIPLPEIAEQVAIAEALSDIDSLISTLQKLIEKKKAIKQGTMQELLTGKKRLPGFSGKRKRKKLGNYIKFEVGFPFKSQYFNSQHIGLRLIKNRDLKSDDQVYYTTEDVSSEYIVNNGDVLVGMDGDFTPCIWRKGVALLNQRVGRIGAFGMDLLFSYYLLQQPLQELQIGTGATTVKHLSHFDVEELELTFPEEIKEQQAIAQVLSDMDNDIEQLEKKLAKYQQIKQGMMQELITGRIRLV